MKSGTCPKCGSSEIYRSPNKKRLGLEGYSIFIKSGWFTQTYTHLIYYVCGQCRYVQCIVADAKSANNIRKEWTPMNPRKSKRKNDE